MDRDRRLRHRRSRRSSTVGYDPEVWTGYAFGMGIERLAMTSTASMTSAYFYQNDLRFLKQFAWTP
jgi:phenylalanyl-tRNA synthetase alpha subunit